MFDHKNIKNEQLQHFLKGTMSDTLGMEIVELGEDFLTMRMPVDHRTIQPYGILNGGASMALAETVASYAGNILVRAEDKHCVGLEINGNHTKAVREGFVYGTATPIHIGKRTHVWNIDIKDESGDIVCKSRMTLAVFPNQK
ncbi:MAG: hotdog fold thioesterase [Bacteroidetes bacterium]|jgi:1,4-dihydroxy-2-naphthoyl-CoA hydrolase|nr:hotdog fold thioesterase [Bacteroidota bacterium]